MCRLRAWERGGQRGVGEGEQRDQERAGQSRGEGGRGSRTDSCNATLHYSSRQDRPSGLQHA